MAIRLEDTIADRKRRRSAKSAPGLVVRIGSAIDGAIRLASRCMAVLADALTPVSQDRRSLEVRMRQLDALHRIHLCLVEINHTLAALDRERA